MFTGFKAFDTCSGNRAMYMLYRQMTSSKTNIRMGAKRPLSTTSTYNKGPKHKILSQNNCFVYEVPQKINFRYKTRFSI